MSTTKFQTTQFIVLDLIFIVLITQNEKLIILFILNRIKQLKSIPLIDECFDLYAVFEEQCWCLRIRYLNYHSILLLYFKLNNRMKIVFTKRLLAI